MGEPQKREKLPQEMVRALLSAIEGDDVLLWASIEKARQELDEAVGKARKRLQANPLTPLVAADVARRAGFKDARIEVDDNGTINAVLLGNGTRAWHSNLPSLAELRAEAEKLGVDISRLGRSRRLISEAIANRQKMISDAMSDHRKA